MTQLVNALDRLIGWIAAAILLTAFCLMAFSVFARYVAVNWQIDWILEVVVFMIAWAVMLGVARIEKRAGHIRVDFVLNMMSDKTQRIAEFFALIFALAVGVFYVYAGVFVVQEAIQWGEKTDSTLQIPFWIYYLCMSVAFSIHAIFIIHRLRGVLSGAPLLKEQDLAD